MIFEFSCHLTAIFKRANSDFFVRFFDQLEPTHLADSCRSFLGRESYVALGELKG